MQVLEAQAPFSILATEPRADERTRVLKQGESFAVFDRHGAIVPAGLGELGLFHEGTRFLSRLELFLGERRPLLLSSTVRDDSALLVDLTNPDFKEGPAARPVPRHAPPLRPELPLGRRVLRPLAGPQLRARPGRPAAGAGLRRRLCRHLRGPGDGTAAPGASARSHGGPRHGRARLSGSRRRDPADAPRLLRGAGRDPRIVRTLPPADRCRMRSRPISSRSPARPASGSRRSSSSTMPWRQ